MLIRNSTECYAKKKKNATVFSYVVCGSKFSQYSSLIKTHSWEAIFMWSVSTKYEVKETHIAALVKKEFW